MSEVVLNRSINLYENQKPRRRRESDKSPAPSGPTSINPGPWLLEIVGDFWMSQSEPRTQGQIAEYEAAIEIRDAYRLVPRYKRLRRPVLVHGQPWEHEQPGTEFIEDDFLTLENCSLCFAEADVAALKADDSSAGFSMLGQTGVLAGIKLHEYQTNRAAELEEYKAKPAKTSKDKGDSVTKNKYVFIPDEAMDAAYLSWFTDRSDGNKQILWETLHNFFSRETSLARKGDDLHAQGQSDDFQQNIVIRLLAVMEKKADRGRKIEQPSNYLRRTWKNCRITAFKKLNKNNETWLSVDLPNAGGSDGPSEDEGADAPNRLDKESHRSWVSGQNSIGEVAEDAETIRQRRLAKLPLLPEDVRDVVGMRLLGKTQSEIGAERGVSQQAVSKKLKKATCLLRAMPDVAVSNV